MEKLKAGWNKFKKTKFYRIFKEYVGADDWIALVILCFGISYYLLKGCLENYPGLLTFYENIHAELIGIGVTVLILGNANQAIRIKQEKRRLILQMGSPDNAFVKEAVRQLRERGWLFDGTVRGVYLRKANLQGVNLVQSNLKGADLYLANLKKAELRHIILESADLRRAELEDADLSQAKLMKVDLRSTHLNHTDFSFTFLNSADFRFAKIYMAIFNGAHLDKASLCSVDLRNIQFDSNTTWTGVKFNIGSNGTQWPEDFDPEAAGCILVEDE